MAWSAGCAGGGAGEHPERLHKSRRIGPEEQKRDDAGGRQAAQPGKIGLQPLGAGEPAVPFIAVLDTHAVEKEQQTQGAEQPRRGRLRRERATGEPDEEHRARAQREPFEIRFPNQIANGDGQKQGHQRRSLEDRPQPFHA